MKYYSDKTRKFYDSEKACVDAEKTLEDQRKREAEEKQRLEKTRKERAAAVEDARIAAIEAQKNYKKVLDEFIKDYNGYHYTINSDTIESPFSLLFKLLDV